MNLLMLFFDEHFYNNNSMVLHRVLEVGQGSKIRGGLRKLLFRNTSRGECTLPWRRRSRLQTVTGMTTWRIDVGPRFFYHPTEGFDLESLI